MIHALIRKYLLRVLFFCSFLPLAVAQQSHILCGNDLFSRMMEEHHPGLHQSFIAAFESARAAPQARSQDELTIRVVVHVIWNEQAENLHDSIIYDQIRILNEDFSRRNADTVNLRPVFQPVAGNAGIRFELVEIIRVETDVKFNIDILGTNLLSEVKHSGEGGSDAIEPESYLNIWVCRIQPLTIFGVEIGQILGFAFPPADLPNWPAGMGAPGPGEDGVVIDYRVFGGNNPNPVSIPGAGPVLVKGRTPVHEVGHYLGLRHIWGDGGLLGPNDCDQSDGIDDTPFADSQSDFDCDTTKNSCERIEEFYGMDMPDLIENFMDYASEDCMNMFTAGQVELMRNVLLGPRSGLLEPLSGTRDRIPHGLSLHVFPNPAHGPVTIELEVKTPVVASVLIGSADGIAKEAVEKKAYGAGRHRIECRQDIFPAPGVYFVIVRTGHGPLVKRLIVQ